MIRISKFIVTFCCFLLLINKHTEAQINAIKFANPTKDSINTSSGQIFMSGIILQKPFGKLTINNQPVNIANTGGFAIKIDSLKDGVNTITVNYFLKKEYSTQTFIVNKQPVKKPNYIDSFAIANISTYPENIQWAKVGDAIIMTAKATPGMQLFCNNIELYETNAGNNNAGIYKGTYTVQNKDLGKDITFNYTLKNMRNGNVIHQAWPNTIHILSDSMTIGHTIGKLPYMMYGYGDDRLGGAKMTYLDSLIPFIVTGKINNNYRVQLSATQSAYIPVSNLALDVNSTISPTILSGNWRVETREKGDIISIRLEDRRPYSSVTEVNPSRLMVDIYGTISNSNWITQLQNLKVIRNVWYEQLPNNTLRVYIDLKNPQLWGYDIHYENNNLVIFIKDAPKSNKWSDLTIAIDAGHGGDNMGADGLTGAYEKDITLQMALKLSAQLKALGAKMIMTRTKDTSISMVERILQLKKEAPDLLVSLHCNSTDNPLIQGNSTYYRYIGFADLSRCIHKEMLQLGMQDYGEVGSFNFALNGPTNYVNALNELAFLSNPEDEAKLLDPLWQNKMINATIKGIKDFVHNAVPTQKTEKKRKK